MEYSPRYSQPFTLEEARLLPVPIIAEEIARLQNSLAHLQRTQEALEEALRTDPADGDLKDAFDENEVVVGSQKERIMILRMVLVEKGVPMGAHYDVQAPSQTPQPQSGTTRTQGVQPSTGHRPAAPAGIHDGDPDPRTNGGPEGEQGVYL
ncbi:hypothetical protein BD413DRAFT_549755 [Trametes elegans]|nr:hypothetical protein BD413DRAFT_549755 [Trametes elegans]